MSGTALWKYMIIVGNTWLLWTHPTFMGTGSILGLSAAEEPEEQPTIVKEVNIIIQRMDGTYTSPVLHLGFKPNDVFFFCRLSL